MDMDKRGLTVIEALVVIVLLVILALLVLPVLLMLAPDPHREAILRSSCQNNLKQWGLVLKMYSDESKGEKYPPLCVTVQDAMDCDAVPPTVVEKDSGIVAIGPSVPAVFPEYLTDAAIIFCPTDLKELHDVLKNPVSGEIVLPYLCADHKSNTGMGMIDASYVYLGYLLDKVDMDDPGTDVAEIAALLGADLTGTVPGQVLEVMKYVLVQPLLDGKRDYTTAEQRADEDMSLPAYGLGNGGGDTIYRLREGIERFLISGFVTRPSRCCSYRKHYLDYARQLFGRYEVLQP